MGIIKNWINNRVDEHIRKILAEEVAVELARKLEAVFVRKVDIATCEKCGCLVETGTLSPFSDRTLCVGCEEYEANISDFAENLISPAKKTKKTPKAKMSGKL